MIYKNKNHFFVSYFTCGIDNFSIPAKFQRYLSEYVIQEGDFLSIVAARFSTTLDEIVRINQISDLIQ